MQLAGTQFTNTSAIFGNDISTLPDFPAEIRRPGRHAGRRLRLPDPFLQPATSHTPGDDGRHAGRHEPRRAARPTSATCEPGGILIVNDDAFDTQRTCTRPATKTTRWRTARSKATASSAIAIDKLNRRGRGRDQAQPTRGRPLQELLRPGAGLLALRPAAGADAPLDPGQVRQESRASSKPTPGRSRPATTTARPPKRSPCTTASPRPRFHPGRYRKITGNEAAGHRPGHRRASWPASQLVLRQLSDHAGQRHPARTVATARTSASAPSRPRTKSPPSARPSARAFGGALGASPPPAARASASRARRSAWRS